MIRQRFRKRSDQNTLDAATRHPEDPDQIQQLADVISRHLREDPAFATQVHALWRDFESAGHGGQVSNLVSGQVHGSVVQARDVQGGITFNDQPSRPH